ncbi:hypothetical protein ABK040_003412 [Willaertia magna]
MEQNANNMLKQEEDDKTRILFLGILYSGKSTHLRQIQLLKQDFREYGNLFTIFEPNSFTQYIHSNIFYSLLFLVEEVYDRKLEHLFENKNLAEELLKSRNEYYAFKNKELVDRLPLLYNENVIQSLLKGDTLNNFDYFNLDYYIKNTLSRMNDKFIPTVTDVLNVRQRLKQYEFYYKENNKRFIVKDMDGVKHEKEMMFGPNSDTERRIYKHDFDYSSYNIIVLHVSLVDFYLECEEVTNQNRLRESLYFFNYLFNDKFKDDIYEKVIVFTKVDVFVKKIKEGASIKKYFNEFNGYEHNPVEVFEFILNLFKSNLKSGTFKYHVLNILDFNEVEQTFLNITSKQGHFISPLLREDTESKFKQKLLSDTNKNLCDLKVTML